MLQSMGSKRAGHSWTINSCLTMPPTFEHTFRLLQFSSVAQSCLTLCNPTNRSTPGLLVHHHLPESTQTHVHGVWDAIIILVLFNWICCDHIILLIISKKESGTITKHFYNERNGGMKRFLMRGYVSKTGGVRTSENPLLHRSNENTGKNGQNQLFKTGN